MSSVTVHYNDYIVFINNKIIFIQSKCRPQNCATRGGPPSPSRYTTGLSYYIVMFKFMKTLGKLFAINRRGS